MKPVRKAIVDKREELSARADLLRKQWQDVRDDQAKRRAELNAVEADIVEIDAWLTANPPV